MPSSLDELEITPAEHDTVLQELETEQWRTLDANSDRVKNCLANMSQEHILLILLRYCMGYDYPTLMQILRIEAATASDPARNVRQRLFNAMNALRNCATN